MIKPLELTYIGTASVLRHSILNPAHLPRQARDKHGKIDVSYHIRSGRVESSARPGTARDSAAQTAADTAPESRSRQRCEARPQRGVRMG